MPQKPFAPQQGPNEERVHVNPVLPPHVPSTETDKGNVARRMLANGHPGCTVVVVVVVVACVVVSITSVDVSVMVAEVFVVVAASVVVVVASGILVWMHEQPAETISGTNAARADFQAANSVAAAVAGAASRFTGSWGFRLVTVWVLVTVTSPSVTTLVDVAGLVDVGQQTSRDRIVLGTHTQWSLLQQNSFEWW
jgi:hypothetical protein